MVLENIQSFLNFNEITIMTSSILLPLSVFAFFILTQGISRRFKLQKIGPPGPIGFPLFGYLPFLRKEPHKTIWNLRKKYGNVISFYLGSKYTIVLNEYNAMKQVLSHPGSLDRVTKPFNHVRPLGFGLEDGESWIEQRRFTMSTAKSLGIGRDCCGPLIMEEMSHLIKKLQEIQGKPFDISKDLLYSLNTSILSLLIGRRLGENEQDNIHISADFTEAAIAKISPANPTSFIPGLRKVYEIFKLGDYDKRRDTIHQFHSFIKGEIQIHKTSPLLRDIPDYVNAYLKKLSEMSKSKKGHYFSEIMLQGNLVALFLGSSDVIFSSLGWLFRIMSKHQDIQEKVYTELIQVLGENGQAKYEERDKIPYTFAVLMESQRYSSIVPLSALRKANQDIPINGYIIPKGSEITANLWALHHDPTYWDNPDEFQPERFLTDGGTKIDKHSLSFAPFSFGKRNCPGESIAWMEILCYFSEIIKRFKISTPSKVQPEFEVIPGLVARLKPQPLCFKERNI